ncbi:MAG: HpcH/HpaI aldolase family protein [Bryobacteraceae bacterium]
MAKLGVITTTKQPDPNRLGAKLRSSLVPGKPALGGIVIEQLRPSLIKLYQMAGFDFIYLETEHVLFEPTRLTDFILAARDHEMPVVAKVPDLQRPWVAFLLEAGVAGIQLPRTESRAELLQLLDWMRFPPRGTRAGAPCFGNVDYAWPKNHKAWMNGADANTLVVVHIETQRGFDNFEEIVTTPDIGMIYVGPYDFSISAGHPGEYDHPEVKQRMLKMLKLCLKHNVPFGTTPSGAAGAKFWASRGASFFEACDEMTFIHQGAVDLVSSWRKRIG